MIHTLPLLFIWVVLHPPLTNILFCQTSWDGSNSHFYFRTRCLLKTRKISLIDFMSFLHCVLTTCTEWAFPEQVSTHSRSFYYILITRGGQELWCTAAEAWPSAIQGPAGLVFTVSLFETTRVNVLLDANYCFRRICKVRIGCGKSCRHFRFRLLVGFGAPGPEGSRLAWRGQNDNYQQVKLGVDFESQQRSLRMISVEIQQKEVHKSLLRRCMVATRIRGDLWHQLLKSYSAAMNRAFVQSDP